MTEEKLLDIPDTVTSFEEQFQAAAAEEVEDMLGSESLIGSNLWKVSDLINGAATGRYSEGFHYSLDILPLEKIPEVALSKEGSDHILEVNRQMLDRLSELNGVDFKKVMIYEREDDGQTSRVTVYPSTLGISFVEQAAVGADGVAREYGASVFTGTPDYFEEEGYRVVS